jgi:AAHS family benzoate transporter-like MFS transporter
MNFLVIAVPGFIAALAIFFVNLNASVEKTQTAEAPTTQQNIVGNTIN